MKDKKGFIVIGSPGVGDSTALRKAVERFKEHDIIVVDENVSPVELKEAIMAHRDINGQEMIAFEPIPGKPMVLTNHYNLEASKPKINCKKGHNYKRVEIEESKNYFSSNWVCDCGKTL